MIKIEARSVESNGVRIVTEALMLYVQGKRFCLAINSYIELGR